jgi:hypothetical protein
MPCHKLCLYASVFAFFIVSPICLANHGPGTSGGGNVTLSGETLKPGEFAFALRTDFTKFENISRAEAEHRAASSGGFDTINHATILTTAAEVGVFDNFQLGLSQGYYFGGHFISADRADNGTVDSATADPQGLTDLALSAKYRVLQGWPGNLAIVGGILTPTGRHDIRLSNDHLLEASSQPGTGAWGYQFGLAYSRFLTSRLTMDSSALYTLRTSHEHFTVGDRLDLGTALAWRLTENIKAFPNWSVFAETNAVWIGKDDDLGEKNPNSGGWTIYVSPGLRVRWNRHVAFTISPSFPVYQGLNGDQVEALWKLSATLSISF